FSGAGGVVPTGPAGEHDRSVHRCHFLRRAGSYLVGTRLRTLKGRTEMPGIRVLADSACDLPDEIVAEHRLTIVPLTIRVGDDDATAATPQEFWAMCRHSSAL